MSDGEEPKRFIVSIAQLPSQFPTNKHAPEFWEALGRAVATFGFLEETLGKAIFSFTGTKKLEKEPSQEEFEAWFKKLERALSDTLAPLIDGYASAVKKHGEATITNLDDLVEDLRKVADYRNVICHGSWQPPNDAGKSIPLFVNRKQEVFDTAIDIVFLTKLQAETARLSCEVINTVTHMGWQFPGSSGPGKAIW